MDRGPSALSPEGADPRPRVAHDGGRRDELDVLVVGGGVVGAGIALDAVTRGLRRAAGAARPRQRHRSRSSKLIHGGLRYLEMLDSGWCARR